MRSKTSHCPARCHDTRGIFLPVEPSRELRAVLALACRSNQTVGAQGQAQGRQAGSGKRQRRRVDIVRPSTANTKVRLPTAVVIAKVPPTIAVAKTKVRPTTSKANVPPAIAVAIAEVRTTTATTKTKVRPDTATMRTLGGCRHGKRRKDSG
jgi:hypothetical protein